MTIIPENDSGQTVTLSTDEINVSETNLTSPTFIYENLTISDDDNSPCNLQLLRAAQVTINDIAADSAGDVLMVREDKCMCIARDVL